MARQIKKNSATETQERLFQSLIFPMKKKWVVKGPDIRGKKSVMKKSIAAFNSGVSAAGSTGNPTKPGGN